MTLAVHVCVRMTSRSCIQLKICPSRRINPLKAGLRGIFEKSLISSTKVKCGEQHKSQSHESHHPWPKDSKKRWCGEK